MQQTIIDATLRCLQKYSIEKTSISSIATEARITRATVYSYFPTKEDALHAALMQVVHVFCTRLLKQIEKQTSPQDRLLEAMVYICLEIPKDPYLKFITEPAMAEQVNAMTLASRDGESVRLDMLKKIIGEKTLPKNELETLCELVTRLVVSVLVMPSAKKKTRKELHTLFSRLINPLKIN